MSVREFHDGRGREWRAWEVRPDELDVRTKDEDYLASIYYTGWIVFEDTSGGEKRRLHPIPKGWADLPDRDLEGLLDQAQLVPKRRLTGD